MRKLSVFNNVTLDGYFVDAQGNMGWAHRGMEDPEWLAFIEGNARGEAGFIFGRVTYEMMASYWPTEHALQNNPQVAHRMNSSPKIVFSKTMRRAEWENTTLLRNNVAKEIRRLKKESGPDWVIFGSGSLVSLLTQERLIDEYQIVIVPVLAGSGKTMFEGIKQPLWLKLVESRKFANGNAFLRYHPEI